MKNLIFFTLIPLCACASYGYSDRPDTSAPDAASEGAIPMTFSQLLTPPSRALDANLATRHLQARLRACGASPSQGEAVALTPHLRCEASASDAMGLGQSLWAQVSLSCILSSPDGSALPLTAQATRLLQSHGEDRVASQQAAETDALLDAIDQLACSIVPLPSPHAASHGQTEIE